MNKFQPALIYNLFPLLAGPISGWRTHLERAASMGFNWVFLNPIQQPGESGSLYSVRDYFSLNPLLVAPDERRPPSEILREMLGAAHGLGLKVMLDLVLNHTAIDSPLVRDHPEWYARDKKGRVRHPGVIDGKKKVIWRDLAEIDNAASSERRKLWNWWRKVTDYYLELGFDGFRCDAAYKVPMELWEELIGGSRKRYPEALFFAESLGCPEAQIVELAGAGFDYIFNSSKWWDFRADWALEQYQATRELAPSVSFPETHDTERLFRELDGDIAAMRQRTAFEAFFSTGFMIPMGFEYGFRKRLHVVKTRPSDWEKGGPDLRLFINEVLGFKLGHEVLRFEHPTYRFDLNPASGDVAGLIKLVDQTGPSALLLINRDRATEQRVTANVLDFALPGRGEITLVDVTGGFSRERLEDLNLDRMMPPSALWVLLREK